MKISIIVPVYKVEKYLNRCVDSILAQSHRDIEVILIDDGSPDSCGRICDEYSRLDKRVKVIHQENKGVSSARNAGLDFASGDYIGFVDSDDYIEPDMYETLLHLIKSTEADIACISMAVHDSNGNQEPFQEEDEVHIYTREQAIQNMFYDDNSTSGHLCNKIYKAELFDGLRLDSKIKVREDALIMWDLFFRSKSISFQRKYKYHYLSNPSSAVHSFSPSFLTSRLASQSLLEKTNAHTPQIQKYAQLFLLGADIQIIIMMVEHNCFNRALYVQLRQEIKANMTSEVKRLLKTQRLKSRIRRHLVLNNIQLYALIRKVRKKATTA